MPDVTQDAPSTAMTRNGVVIDDTFAEAFPMSGTAIQVTADSEKWAMEAARSFTGFATSVIACGCEAGIDRDDHSGTRFVVRGDREDSLDHRIVEGQHVPVEHQSMREAHVEVVVERLKQQIKL